MLPPPLKYSVNPLQNTNMAPRPNQAAATLLLRWAQASEESNHTSQAPKTFRRAAKSLREYPSPVTTRAEALAVKFIGDKLADSLQGWFDFQQRAPARRVATLYHGEEGKWWSVTVAGEMAQRSWGKRSATGLEGPGMDNWERPTDERAALQWACQKVVKQLAKGYSHAPGSQALFDSACTDSGGPPAATGRSRSRVVGGDAAATVPPAAAAAVPPATVTVAPATTAAMAAAASKAAPAQRAYQPKLLDARGEVGASAALLVAVHRAHAAGSAALSQVELQRHAQPLCPAHPLGAQPALRGGYRAGPLGGCVKTLLKHGLLVRRAVADGASAADQRGAVRSIGGGRILWAWAPARDGEVAVLEPAARRPVLPEVWSLGLRLGLVDSGRRQHQLPRARRRGGGGRRRGGRARADGHCQARWDR